MRVFSVVGGCAGKTEIARGLVAELSGRGPGVLDASLM